MAVQRVHDVPARSLQPRSSNCSGASAVDLVLAWHTDRLHRSSAGALEDWIEACEHGGVTVHAVRAGQLDLGDAF